MKIMDKRKEINETYMKKGKSAEDFLLADKEDLCALVFGDDIYDVCCNLSTYEITNVAHEHKSGDIIVSKHMATESGVGFTSTKRVDVKAVSYPFQNNIVVEVRLLAYKDKKTGNIVPSQDGWLYKDGADYYAFVYKDEAEKAQRVLVVSASQLKELYEKNKQSYRVIDKDNAECALIPVIDVVENCKDARFFFHGSCITLERVERNDSHSEEDKGNLTKFRACVQVSGNF